MLSDENRRDLIDIAAQAIASELVGSGRWVPDLADVAPALRTPAATFVTLEDVDGSLLGCIGSLAALDALAVDVAIHAAEAAFDDPRLPALRPDQYERMTIEISVLSPLERLDTSSRARLAAELTPGSDGLLIRAGNRQATFLPTVWRQLATTDQFLGQLWRKAGLAPGSWPAGLEAWRYQTECFKDSSPRSLARTG